MRQVVVGFVLAMAAGGVCTWAQEGGDVKPAPTYRVGGHSDSMYAVELLRLNQPSVVKAELAATKGTPAENLWKAQDIYVSWDGLAKGSAEQRRAADDYVGAIKAYLASQRSGVDGVWALAQAKFCFARLSEPVSNRMEYFGSTARDRTLLTPIAETIELLLKQAAVSIEAQKWDAENKKPFDEPAYMRVYGAEEEVQYYGALGQYLKAMALDSQDANRKKLLLAAAQTLSKWADDENDNGVNGQAMLARGKAYVEAGQFDKAMKDFEKAQTMTGAPEWVGFQARYQMVVAKMRKSDYQGAISSFRDFKAGLPKENVQAQLSADMLGFRVLWTSSQDARGESKVKAEREALAVLSEIVNREPRFRRAVFEQIALTVPEGVSGQEVAALHPLQRLAVAYTRSEGQDGKTPESKAAISEALAAAVMVKKDEQAAATDRKEAAFIAATAAARLEDHEAAARYCVEFAEMAPDDLRAKGAVDQAVEEISALRRLRKDTGGLTAEQRDIAERALALATGRYGGRELLYRRGLMLEEGKKWDEARRAYEAIPEEDAEYLDARYRLINVGLAQFGEIAAKGDMPAVQKAGSDLIAACQKFEEILDNPPASAAKEIVEKARSYRTDLWLIEVSTAVDPSVKQTKVAMDRLDKLETVRATLTEAQQGQLFRYRIMAYQNEGETGKALAMLQEYAKSRGQDAKEMIRGMVVSTARELEQMERTNPEGAKALAGFLVKLLDAVIDEAQKQGKPDAVFDWRVSQADIMVRAGEFAAAKKQAEALEKEKPEDLRSYMTEARARYGLAKTSGDKQQYAETQDLFTRIVPKVTPGVESYWECWLRIIECMEVLQGPDGREQIRRRLSDLKGLTGEKFGGVALRPEFVGLAAKYGVQ